MDGLMSTGCFIHIDGDTDSVMKEAARVLKRGSVYDLHAVGHGGCNGHGEGLSNFRFI